MTTSDNGPESAGDDAALIQRKASFDTGRADQASVAQRQSATFTPWKSEGQHLPDARGRHLPSSVDGAGWRGGWLWPT